MSLSKVKLCAVRVVEEKFALTDEFSYPGKTPDDVKMLLYEALYPYGDATFLLSLVELDHCNSRIKEKFVNRVGPHLV